jgi:hypothetical protein
MDDLFTKLLDEVAETYLDMGYSPAQFSEEEALEDVYFKALSDPGSIEGQWYQRATADDLESFRREWRRRCENIRRNW